MDKVIIIGMLIIIIIIGHIIKRVRLKKIRESKNFIIEYNNTLGEYINKLVNNEFDNEKYNYLVGKSKKVQIEMGENAILAFYEDPLKGIRTTNYQFIVNFIPETLEFRYTLDNVLSKERFNQQIIWASSMFNRHINDCNEQEKKIKQEISNPFSCLAEGIRYILIFPIKLLYWFGIISETTTMKISASIIIKILGFLIGLIGFISSIMGIILGWNEFIKLIFPK